MLNRFIVIFFLFISLRLQSQTSEELEDFTHYNIDTFMKFSIFSENCTNQLYQCSSRSILNDSNSDNITYLYLFSGLKENCNDTFKYFAIIDFICHDSISELSKRINGKINSNEKLELMNIYTHIIKIYTINLSKNSMIIIEFVPNNKSLECVKYLVPNQFFNCRHLVIFDEEKRTAGVLSEAY